VQKLFIRRARAGDVGAIAGCVQAAYQKYVARMDRKPGPMLNDYARVIANHHVAVAEGENRQLLGLVVLIEEIDSVLLDNVAVDPSMQGQGVGGRLLEYAEQQAKNLGYSELNLYTHECMTENLRFYHRLGYYNVESRTVDGYARIYMRKDLRKARRRDRR